MRLTCPRRAEFWHGGRPCCSPQGQGRKGKTSSACRAGLGAGVSTQSCSLGCSVLTLCPHSSSSLALPLIQLPAGLSDYAQAQIRAFNTLRKIDVGLAWIIFKEKKKNLPLFECKMCVKAAPGCDQGNGDELNHTAPVGSL